MMQPLLADVETIAREAGAILRQGFSAKHEVTYKGVIDLVTEMDHASERYVLGEIRSRWPGHSIMAEESGLSAGDMEHQWFVDPLDGTINYAHQIPIFCVSIGYAQRGSMQLAVVYDPMRNEMFSAERNKGAFLDGVKIRASGATELQRSLLATGFPYDSWNSEQDNFANFVRLSKRTQGVRRLGSAALDACYVAAGRFDGYWEMSVLPWDVAAGGLIAEEAGARVTNTKNGSGYLSAPPSIVAAAQGIHSQILESLSAS